MIHHFPPVIDPFGKVFHILLDGREGVQSVGDIGRRTLKIPEGQHQFVAPEQELFAGIPGIGAEGIIAIDFRMSFQCFADRIFIDFYSKQVIDIAVGESQMEFQKFEQAFFT